jgi:aconitate hydratase
MASDVRKHGYPAKLSSALIGSCTNSSYEDMSRAADIARQATEGGAATRTALLCTPGSEQIHQTIRRDGQLEDLESIGAMLLANACGPCIGQWRRDDLEPGVPNSIMSSYNRNFPKRNDGNPDTLSFIASPEVVVAYALAGTLEFNPMTDELEGKDGQRFVLQPPAPAPEVPEAGFIFSREGYEDPPADRTSVEVAVAEGSERLQLLEPFAPWDGRDFENLPLLLKPKGKCTTDHISPAGPWLRFRGHLDNISDNAFIGAINAFTGEAGTGKDMLSGETQVGFAKIARHYSAEGLRWVVVGDENYGEGSSREHAAMCPRHLGCAAVIARSFARIHQTNLKKQGVLPLRFSDPAMYDKVQEDDRVSVHGLTELAPGRALQVSFHHSDGTQDSGEVTHTLNEDQIDWFKAGSALNVLRRHD